MEFPCLCHVKKKKKKEKKEKSKKWRLLTNLKTINVYIQPRESLQPGLPNPALIPQSSWLLI